MISMRSLILLNSILIIKVTACSQLFEKLKMFKYVYLLLPYNLFIFILTARYSCSATDEKREASKFFLSQEFYFSPKCSHKTLEMVN